MGVTRLYLFKVRISFVMYIYLSILNFIWCHYILERREKREKKMKEGRVSSVGGTDTGTEG